MKNHRFLSSKGLMVLFLSAWSVYIFYPFKFSEPPISADGVTYVHIAKNIILDGSPGWQATWTSPFFSVLMALLYPAIGNFVVAGLIVSKIMFVLLPLAVYLLAKEVFNPRIGLFAAVLTAFHPHFTSISGSLEPEATYTTLQIFALWAIWRAFQSSRLANRTSEVNSSFFIPYSAFGWAVLGGGLASLAYQTRSEGLLVFIFAIAALGIIATAESWKYLKPLILRFTILSLLVACFILTSLPYLIFLKDTYGKLVLSPKSTYVQIWMKPRIYKDAANWKYYPQFLYSLNMFSSTEGGDIDLWGLSHKGKLNWQEPKSLGDLVDYLMSDPGKNLKIYFHNFSYQLPGRIPNNSGQWLYPQLYPFYFVIPALCWIAFSFRSGADRGKTFYLLSPFAILLILPVFTQGWWKYLIPYSPYLIILAAAGCSLLSERFKLKYIFPIFTVIVAVYSLWTVKASPLVNHGNKEVMRRGSIAQEQKKAGEWAQKTFIGTPNYMIQWTKLAHYLNGRWTAMPVADYKDMIHYARKNKVDYLVFETFGRSESEYVVRFMTSMPDLAVAAIYENPGNYGDYQVVFLELKK